MKYLCLIYYQEKEVYGMSPQDWNTLVSDCVSYGERIRGSGHFISGQPLEPVDTAKTVRVRDGKVTVTDGPFAETKEQLAGFYLLEAADLNEAVQVASHIPPARLGSIEIRPVRELPEMAEMAEMARELAGESAQASAQPGNASPTDRPSIG